MKQKKESRREFPKREIENKERQTNTKINVNRIHLKWLEGLKHVTTKRSLNLLNLRD